MDKIDFKKYIYGSILTSENMSSELRKWRTFFKIKQISLANEMKISPSVISDYELGRQKYPGTQFLLKFVNSLIKIDESKIKITDKFFDNYSFDDKTSPILDIKEYQKPINAKKILELTDCKILVGEDLIDIPIFGHTILDSLMSILNLNDTSFYKIYGNTTERVIFFTQVSIGRSPMVTIKVYPLKPRIVVLHGLDNVDKLAIKIAEKEKIILAISRIKTSKNLINQVKNINLYQLI